MLKNKQVYLIIFCGVKLDSHKWFKIAPFHVALNLVIHSDLASDWAENPAGPTKIKCWTCSGCCDINKIWHQKIKCCHILLLISNYQHRKTITLRAYLAATYPPRECPSKMKLLRFLALRHSSKESINHASVSALSI